MKFPAFTTRVGVTAARREKNEGSIPRILRMKQSNDAESEKLTLKEINRIKNLYKIQNQEERNKRERNQLFNIH